MVRRFVASDKETMAVWSAQVYPASIGVANSWPECNNGRGDSTPSDFGSDLFTGDFVLSRESSSRAQAGIDRSLIYPVIITTLRILIYVINWDQAPAIHAVTKRVEKSAS